MVDKKQARSRTFGTQTPEEVEPLEFVLHGETFNCRPLLQGAVILDFLSAGNDETGSGTAAQILGIFPSALYPEDYVRFTALIRDPDRIVDLETLSEIVGYLIEEYTSRPTKAS